MARLQKEELDRINVNRHLHETVSINYIQKDHWYFN